MTNTGSETKTTSNTGSGYFENHSGLDDFGDKATYSTNTLDNGVTVTVAT